MPTVPLTLIRGDYHSFDVDYSDNLPTNMYAIQRKIHGADGYMLGYPGLTSFGTGLGIDRGGLYNERQENQYRVSGTRFISVAADGTVADIGEITGTKQASMPYSFNTQCVIVDNKMWLYDEATLDEVTDPDLGDPIDGVWVNGYYFLTDGEYIYHTDIADESIIDPLKFATAEFMPDKSLGVLKTQDNKVAVFGRYTIEYFTDTAQANFAFTRIESRAQKIGIVATHAKCELSGNFYITGGPKEEDVGVYKTRASSAVKISTREVDQIIGQYTEPELSDMRMESRFEDNTIFIIVHLPNETLFFNESIAQTLGPTEAWGILKTDIVGDINYRGINIIFDPRNSKWICGDKFNTNIGVLDSLVATHYGEIVEWILYTPFVNLGSFSIDEIEIETVPGFSNSIESVATSLTHNGVTYGTEYWTDYSGVDTYNTRFIVRRLGYVNDWIGFKFRGASLYKMAFSTLKVTFS
jgi:hypothetical protein